MSEKARKRCKIFFWQVWFVAALGCSSSFDGTLLLPKLPDKERSAAAYTHLTERLNLQHQERAREIDRWVQETRGVALNSLNSDQLSRSRLQQEEVIGLINTALRRARESFVHTNSSNAKMTRFFDAAVYPHVRFIMMRAYIDDPASFGVVLATFESQEINQFIRDDLIGHPDLVLGVEQLSEIELAQIASESRGHRHHLETLFGRRLTAKFYADQLKAADIPARRDAVPTPTEVNAQLGDPN